MSSIERNAESPLPDEKEALLTRTALLADLALGRPATLDSTEQSTSGGLLKGLSNETDTLTRLLPKVPGSVGEALADDWTNRRQDVWKKVAISTGLGLGAAILLSRSPALARYLMSVAGVTAGVGATGCAGSFLISAWSADTAVERELLAAGGAKALGRVGAELIETTPGLVAGTAGGIFLTSRVAALESIAMRVRHSVDFRARRLLPERMHYIGTDVRTVTGVARPNGTFDLLQATDEVVALNPWRGVEEGRFFKPGKSSIKFGATMPGTADEVIMGQRADHMIHTHADRLLPTSGDFNSIRGTGIVSVPESGITTFFEGTGIEAENVVALRRSGKLLESRQALDALQQRSFRSLVLDQEKQLALRVDTKWNSFTGMDPVVVTPVDYSQAVRQLRTWNGKGLALSELAPSAHAVLKPGMTDLMRRVLLGS